MSLRFKDDPLVFAFMQMNIVFTVNTNNMKLYTQEFILDMKNSWGVALRQGLCGGWTQDYKA
jgi:hypothetical protein